MPLTLINNDPEILPSNKSGSHKTGSLSRFLTVDDITKTLGFAPNIDDDPDKVEYSWGFTADGIQCGIWDYKESRWSTFGPAWIFERLFPGKVGL